MFGFTLKNIKKKINQQAETKPKATIQKTPEKG